MRTLPHDLAVAGTSSLPGAGIGTGHGGQGRGLSSDDGSGVAMEMAIRPGDDDITVETNPLLQRLVDDREGKSMAEIALMEIEEKDRLIDDDKEEEVSEEKEKEQEALALQQNPEDSGFIKLLKISEYYASPSEDLQTNIETATAEYMEQPDFGGIIAQIREKVLAKEIQEAEIKGMNLQVEKIDSFKTGGWDTPITNAWLISAAEQLQTANVHLKQFLDKNEELKADIDELTRPDEAVVKAWSDKQAEVEKLNQEITSLMNQIDLVALATSSEAEAAARAEMGAKDSVEEKIPQAKLALIIQQLRLKTINPNQKEEYTRVPLRLRRRLHQDIALEQEQDIYTASLRWFTYEKIFHWLFRGDQERKITLDEKLWFARKAKLAELAKRKDRNRWSPYQNVQLNTEKNVGGNVAQIFTFYQFIMNNNFVMTNMWTFFVIIPYFMDPPADLKIDQITWKGLAGLDDKALEYSWFYYGAYKDSVQFWGISYPMGIMYIVVQVMMFVFQLGVMMKGVFESVDGNITLQKITGDPFEGIGFSSTVLCSANHCILNHDVKYDFKLKTRKKLKMLVKKSIEDKASRMGVLPPPAIGEEEPENPVIKRIKIRVGRTIGVLLYLGLFQISTNGIQACYENEEVINQWVPYAVPILVAAQRVLVPVIMVPFLLIFEYREEPNLFYHTIIRMFALKMYTMNVILQVVLSTPVPGGICRAIFIGKVYWRQEMVDLVFTLVLDIIMMVRRIRTTPLPEFDEEELAERVMELLYRQAFIWVSSPYSPMLAYFGLFSTSILYFWQSVTIPMSFVPPVNGWGQKGANASFRVQLLCTALATFYPTWIFLHQHMDCGPHTASVSPYQFMLDQSKLAPEWLHDVLNWLTIPTTTVALLLVTVGLQVFLSAINSSRDYKVNTSLDTFLDEKHDKIQLLRGAGLSI